MSDPFKPLRDVIAEGAASHDPAQRFGSKLLAGALDGVIEFKKQTESGDGDVAGDIAVGLIDAIAMVMASLLSHVDFETAADMANRLADSIGHVIRSRSDVKDVN